MWLFLGPLSLRTDKDNFFLDCWTPSLEQDMGSAHIINMERGDTYDVLEGVFRRNHGTIE